MRPSFLRFYRDMIMTNVDQVASTPRKVRTKEQSRYRYPPHLAPEENARPKSGDKQAPATNLHNQRTALAQYFAGQEHVRTNRQFIERRYNDKIDWYQKHYVSLITFCHSRNNNKCHVFTLNRTMTTRPCASSLRLWRKRSTLFAACEPRSTGRTWITLTGRERRKRSAGRLARNQLIRKC